MSMSETDETVDPAPREPGLYDDFGVIDSWATAVKEETLEVLGDPMPENVHSTAEDPLQQRRTDGKNQLTRSEAYSWLVAAIKQHLQLDCISAKTRNTNHETIISHLDSMTSLLADVKYTRVSHRRPANTFVVALEMAWDLLGFLRTQRQDVKSSTTALGSIVTLTGDEQYVQALRCEDYLEQTWPTTGRNLLKVMTELVSEPDLHHTGQLEFLFV